MIIGSKKVLAIGEKRLGITNHQGEHIDQPFVVIKESNFISYWENLSPKAKEYIRLRSFDFSQDYFYEVSTD